MPIFMDRHDIKGITAKHVSEVHQADLKVQDKFGCKTLTYWFDEKTGMAFCLVDAPEKNAVVEMHNNAHGVIPNQIIEVEAHLVEAFLGRIADPKQPASEPELIINESAVRTIMYIEFQMNEFLYQRKQNSKNPTGLDAFNNFIHKTMQEKGCRKIKDTDDGFLASFTSVDNAIKCAIEIQRKFKEHNKHTSKAKIKAAIGISSGAPVTEREDLFGKTIWQAKRLCYIADDGQILISSEISGIRFNDNLVKSLKPDEEKFLNQLLDITDKFWNRVNFKVGDYSKQIGVSQSQLYRKTLSLTGISPNEFIREFRLKKALKLIEKHKGNISEVAFEAGFSNPSYFTQCFHKRFGLLPSEYESFVS